MTRATAWLGPARRFTALSALALALAACGGGEPAAGPTPSATSTSATSTPAPVESTTTTVPPSTPDPPPDPLAGWSLEQKVGQLFMVGVDVSAPQDASYAAITDRHVGNLFLAGRTRAGTTAIKQLVDSFTVLVTPESTNGEPLFVATDQEGGLVQVLQGSGFSEMPRGTDQAAIDPATLQADAATWGAELAAAGVNLNLAPVMDLVPSAADAPGNPPVGYFGRNYGFTPDDVTAHANAFSAGMEQSGVDVTIKHFPGLGRVTANTDTTAGVTDELTTRDDPSVAIFASGIDAGAAFVMTSTAVYTNIDTELPAAFSPVVIDGMLRGDLGFDGVVITDDVSAAAQVQSWTPADRALLTIDAGGDMVLASADPSVIAEMVDAVVARASTDPAFADKVDAAVVRVLAAKDRLS